MLAPRFFLRWLSEDHAFGFELFVGGLHIIGHELATDGGAFAEYSTRHELDVLKIVPSHFSALLAEGGVGEGVGTGAQCGYEERGRLRFPGVAIVDRNGGTGPVDEGFVARPVLLA